MNLEYYPTIFPVLFLNRSATVILANRCNGKIDMGEINRNTLIVESGLSIRSYNVVLNNSDKMGYPSQFGNHLRSEDLTVSF